MQIKNSEFWCHLNKGLLVKRVCLDIITKLFNITDTDTTRSKGYLSNVKHKSMFLEISQTN